MTLSSSSMRRTFVPKSKVLRERRLVAFDSDEEGDTQVISSPPCEGKMEDPSAAASEIAYVFNGRVESEVIGVDLRTALQSLPKDAWTTLLDDADRAKLAAYLPSLQGWQDLPIGEAQRCNVEALLGGENFHFGNPLALLENRLREGSHTHRAVVAREKRQNVEKARYELERQSILRDRILALKRLGKRHYDDSTGSSFREWKKLRLRSDPSYIHSGRKMSLFAAMRSILTKNRLRADQVAAQLQSDFGALCAEIEQDIPLHFTFTGYITIALAFLADGQPPSSNNDRSNPVFVKHDTESDCFEWLTGSADAGDEVRVLLWVEELFRAPLPGKFLSTYRKNATWATKRLDRMLRQHALGELLTSDPMFPFLERFSTSRPSSVLKRSLVSKTATDDGNRDATSDLRAQESKRFGNPDQPFVYTDERGIEYPVGPSFAAASVSRYHNERVLFAEASINLVTLVYDACARLPSGRGTRGDIKQNLKLSQYVRPEATDEDIDKAIVASLEVLERVPPPGSPSPCVRFDGKTSCWIYMSSTGKSPASGSAFDALHVQGTTPSKRSMKDLLH